MPKWIKSREFIVAFGDGAYLLPRGYNALVKESGAFTRYILNDLL